MQDHFTESEETSVSHESEQSSASYMESLPDESADTFDEEPSSSCDMASMSHEPMQLSQHDFEEFKAYIKKELTESRNGFIEQSLVLDDAIAQIKTLVEQNTELRRRLDTVETTCEQLRHQVAQPVDLSHQLTPIQAQLHELAESNNSMNQRQQTHATELAALGVRVTGNTTKCDSYQSITATLNTNVSHNSASITSHQQSLLALQAKDTYRGQQIDTINDRQQKQAVLNKKLEHHSHVFSKGQIHNYQHQVNTSQPVSHPGNFQIFDEKNGRDAFLNGL